MIKNIFSSLFSAGRSRDRPPKPPTAAHPSDEPKPEEEKREIVLFTGNDAFEQLVCRELERQEPALVFRTASSAEDALHLCRERQAFALIAEIAPESPYTVEEQEALCRAAGCKRLWLVDQQAYPRLAKAAARNKKDGLIDALLFPSVSPSYLAALLDTM